MSNDTRVYANIMIWVLAGIILFVVISVIFALIDITARSGSSTSRVVRCWDSSGELTDSYDDVMTAYTDNGATIWVDKQSHYHYRIGYRCAIDDIVVNGDSQ